MRLIIEILAVIFSLLCVILTIKKKILSWPIGILGVIFYFILFFDRKMYAESILQIIFLIQGIIGWIYWNKNKKINEIKKLNIVEFFIHIFFVIVLSRLTGVLFFNFTNNPYPYIDSFLAILSLLANFYLIKKFIQSWYLWIVVDVIYVFYFAFNEMYLSSGLYFVFLILAIKGLFDWNNIKHEKI